MNPSLRAAASLLLCAAAGLFAPIPGQAQAVSSVRSVQVLSKQNPLEIEIEGSESLIPQAQILSDPDRLVVDFANAVPGAQLRNQTLNSQEIKSVARHASCPGFKRSAGLSDFSLWPNCHH
jgi:hypothetical protein